MSLAPGTSTATANTDILWCNGTGQLNIWQATSDNDFITSFSSTIAGTDWQVVGTGDANGDGLSGILWRNDDGQFNEWDATSDGNFVTSFTSTIAGTDWHVDGTGDFDGDGRADVLLRATDGTLQIWTGSASGAILSPTEKVWEDAIAGVGQLMDEITHQLETSTLPPNDDSESTSAGLVPTPSQATYSAWRRRPGMPASIR